MKHLQKKCSDRFICEARRDRLVGQPLQRTFGILLQRYRLLQLGMGDHDRVHVLGSVAQFSGEDIRKLPLSMRKTNLGPAAGACANAMRMRSGSSRVFLMWRCGRRCAQCDRPFHCCLSTHHIHMRNQPIPPWKDRRTGARHRHYRRSSQHPAGGYLLLRARMPN